jgi:hypothetical protein
VSFLPHWRSAGPVREGLVQEEILRTLLLATLLSIATSAVALADADVAGTWRANLGNGVTVDMNVTADGKWSSQTSQRRKVVTQMKGTYEQQPSNSTAGTIVFTPTQSSGPNGSAQVETDQYEIAENGKRLKLTTEGDTLVFEKRGRH